MHRLTDAMHTAGRRPMYRHCEFGMKVPHLWCDSHRPTSFKVKRSLWSQVPLMQTHPTAYLLTNRDGVSKTSAFRFVSWTVYIFPVPNSQPTATELFQSPLYGSGTVFRSISHLLRHFLSSALVWRHTSSNSVTRNYCCRASEVTLSFMDTLIALT